MKRDGADRMFPFANQGINECGSRYEPKSNQPGSLNKVSGSGIFPKIYRQLPIHQALKKNCFIAALAVGALFSA